MSCNDFISMSETIEGLRIMFRKWNKAFESKGLKVNLGKANMMVTVGVIIDGLFKSTVDTCRIHRV